MDPPKDRTSESSYSQVKSQVKTMTEKIRIIEGSSARGSVNLNNLTNFSEVIMPLKFKALKFIKYDGTGDLAPICTCFVGRWHPIETIILCSARFSFIA